jgi:SAM-dependent methyltransferase
MDTINFSPQAVALSRACAGCGSRAGKLLHRQRFTEMSTGSLLDGYDVVVCAACGFGFADNLPDQAVFDRYYQEMSKYEYQDRGGQESAYDLARFQAIAGFIQPYLPTAAAGILDVGCATGKLLALLQEAGYANVLGLDPSPVCRQAAQTLYGLRVLPGTLSDIQAGTHAFDMLILSGVLEHIRDLGGALAVIRNLLVPGGQVFIEVPDAPEFAHWPDAPFQEFSTEHINFFSAISLTNLMQTHRFAPVVSRQNNRPQSYGTVMPVVSAIYRRVESIPPTVQPDTTTEAGLAAYIRCSQVVDDKIRRTIDGLNQRQQPIIVWGVGTHTQRLLAAGNLAQVPITAFVDSNPRYQGKLLHGSPIVPPAWLHNRPEPILISSRVFQQEIARQITADLGLANELILLYDDLNGSGSHPHPLPLKGLSLHKSGVSA